MARYDYCCIGCQHRFEAQHAPHEAPLISCPLCGGIAEKRLNPAAVKFLTHPENALPEAATHAQEHCTHSGCAWHRSF